MRFHERNLYNGDSSRLTPCGSHPTGFSSLSIHNSASYPFSVTFGETNTGRLLETMPGSAHHFRDFRQADQFSWLRTQGDRKGISLPGFDRREITMDKQVIVSAAFRRRLLSSPGSS